MSQTNKNRPVNFRPDADDEQQLEELSSETGLPKSEILRRACRYSFPKFRSGEVDISRVISRVAKVPVKTGK